MERLSKLRGTEGLRRPDGQQPDDLKQLHRRLEAWAKLGSSCTLSTTEGDATEEFCMGLLSPGDARQRLSSSVRTSSWSERSANTPFSEHPDEQPESGAHLEFDLTMEEESLETKQESVPLSLQSGRVSPVKPAQQQQKQQQQQAQDQQLLNKEASLPHEGSSKRPVLREYLHGHVPRNMDLAMEYQNANGESPPTTLMIRNIPNRYTQRELILELEDLGFVGTFDFFYLPLDKGTMMNVGYAFVNFVVPECAEKCMQIFKNYRFKRHRKISGKTAAVSVAHIQGLAANLAHYEKAAVNTAKLKQRRPVVLAKISQSGPEEELAEKGMK